MVLIISLVLLLVATPLLLNLKLNMRKMIEGRLLPSV
nr:MAG TPA: hypothetical protein [Caudoviricetes sp.]